MDLERARTMMKENDLDALLASSCHHIFYMTGFRSHSLTLYKEAAAYCLMSREEIDNPYLIASSFDYRVTAEKPCFAKKRIFYGSFYIEGVERLRTVENPIDGLKEAISELGLGKGTIGIEETILPVSTYRSLKDALENVRLVDAMFVFKKLRTLKTEEEIRRIRKSTESIEKGIVAAVSVAREGLSLRQLRVALKKAVIDEGADAHFVQIGTNPRGAGLYQDSKLKTGDIGRFDVGAIFDGYVSDIARTFVVGKPTEKQQRIYKTILKAQQAAMDLVKPGVKASDILKAAVSTVNKEGFANYRRRHVGHGLGLEAMEDPVLTPFNNTVLEAGMVINVEVPYYIVDAGPFTVEDTILVTEDGYKPVSSLERELFEI